MKRIRCATLVAAMLLSTLAGCSDGDSVNEVVNTDTGDFNEFGWEIPEQTLVVNILDVAGNDAPNEAKKQGRLNTIEFYKEELI